MQGDKNSRKQSPQGDLHAYLGWKITQQYSRNRRSVLEYSRHVQVNLDFLDNTVMRDLQMFLYSQWDHDVESCGERKPFADTAESQTTLPLSSRAVRGRSCAS
jgi:hypothetical protein